MVEAYELFDAWGDCPTMMICEGHVDDATYMAAAKRYMDGEWGEHEYDLPEAQFIKRGYMHKFFKGPDPDAWEMRFCDDDNSNAIPVTYIEY